MSYAEGEKLGELDTYTVLTSKRCVGGEGFELLSELLSSTPRHPRPGGGTYDIIYGLSLRTSKEHVILEKLQTRRLCDNSD